MSTEFLTTDFEKVSYPPRSGKMTPLSIANLGA
jgi:hypothetical protein